MSRPGQSEPSVTVGGILMFVIIAGAVAWLASNIWMNRPPQRRPRLEKSSLGTLDPSWKIQSLDGKTLTVGDLKKPLFINIFATWCGPCVSEMPSIEALYKSMRDKDVQFLIVSEESPKTVAAAVAQHGWKLPVYTSVGDLSEVLQTDGIPATFVANSKGEIVFHEVGANDWDSPKTREFLLSLK